MKNLYSGGMMMKFVLIDTWWNVNYFFEINGIGGHAVLIDTWWNVN